MEIGSSFQVDFTQRIKEVIHSIPPGRVATYGQVARLAGSSLAVRRVVWILHACSEKEGLPWQRVVDRRGRIALRPGQGFEEQRRLLKAEGVLCDRSGQIDLNKFGWSVEELI